MEKCKSPRWELLKLNPIISDEVKILSTSDILPFLSTNLLKAIEISISIWCISFMCYSWNKSWREQCWNSQFYIDHFGVTWKKLEVLLFLVLVGSWCGLMWKKHFNLTVMGCIMVYVQCRALYLDCTCDGIYICR